jgi:hypothetical protein
VVRPQAQDIAVPPFPPGTTWIGPEPRPVDRICARGPLLVHFVDVAHVNSVRTLDYVRRWAARYSDLGLTVVGVNSPRFPFTAEPDKLAAALRRLEVGFPVALDSAYEIWHDYGCGGWPSLFLWGTGGALSWFHFGEGEYQATEAAIQAELSGVRGRGVEPPETLAPLRPSDEPEALVATPSEEVFPGGSASRPWHATDDDGQLEIDYAAGGAWATVDGRGALRISIDRGPETTISVEAPGAYELASHDCHESHELSLGATPGVTVYSVGFAAGVPPPA